MANLEFEREALARFVVPSKRDRCITFASSPCTRNKLLAELRQPSLFDPRWVTELLGRERATDALLTRFRAVGMGENVYVISSAHEWDGTMQALASFVPACIGACVDVLAYCPCSRVAFYEQHHSGFTFLLHRPERAA